MRFERACPPGRFASVLTISAFAVEEHPPLGALWLLAGQHAVTVLASIVYVLTAAQMAGLDTAGSHALVAVSLIGMVALPVWAKGRLRLVGLLTGILIGVAMASAAGRVSSLDAVISAPWFALPVMHAPVMSLDGSVLLIVVLIAIVKQLDNVGCVIAVDKMNNADWRRLDMKSLSGGIKANGLGDLIGGFAGAFPTGISSSCVALAHATRSTSRHIGLAVATILLVLVFMPKVTLMLTLVPMPVLGAVGIFAAAFLLVSGVELIASRALDSRTIFAVGLSTLAGADVLLMPQVIEQLPQDMRKLIGNPLIVTGILVVGLNLLFRIGIAQNASLTLLPDDPHPGRTITDFVERQGALWSARRDLVHRAASAALEAAESIRTAGRGWPVAVQGRFDEFRLDIDLVHTGAPLQLSGNTTAAVDLEALMNDDDADLSAIDSMMEKISNQLIQRLADRVSTTVDKGRQSMHRLQFDH